MCGRYALNIPAPVFLDYFSALGEGLDWTPRYNLGPLQFAPVIRQRPSGERVAQRLRWGLVPSWKEDASGAAKLIIARGETVSERPSFRSAFKARRCLIPAAGFFEWQVVPGGKQPYFIQPTQAPVFGLAGLWERWNQADGSPLDTFTVITTAVNAAMQAVHERMPVILAPTEFATWLSRDTPADALRPLLRPCDPGWLRLHPVSKAIGNIRNDSADLIAPLSVPES